MLFTHFVLRVPVRSGIWCRWTAFLLGGFVCSAANTVLASEDSGSCIPKPTQPLPSCSSPQSAYERGWLALVQARELFAEEKWADAAVALRRYAVDFDASGDLSLTVQQHSLLGRIFSRRGELALAVDELRRAAELWSSPRALEFIRALPDGEQSQASIRAAVDAAAAAVFEIAEIRRRQLIAPCPEFKLPNARGSSTSVAAEAVAHGESRHVRRIKAKLMKYLENDVRPWAIANREAIGVVSREYEKVYLVPPAAPSSWRVAVAQRIGQMWAERVATIRSVLSPPEPSRYSLMEPNFYWPSGDDWGEEEKQIARLAFDACVHLSRQHHLYSEHTEQCELWLAKNYRAEYHLLDEISPYAQYLPGNSYHQAAPETLRP